MRDAILHLDVRARGCIAEAFLDGIPVAQVGRGLPDDKGEVPPTPFALRESKPVQHIAIPGENRMDLVLRRAPRAAEDEDEDHGEGDAAGADRDAWLEGASAIARLAWFADGEFADSDEAGRVVAEIVLPPPAAASPAAVRPASAFTTVDLGGALGRRAWEDAAILSMTPTLLSAAEGAYRAVATALEAGDVDAFFALARPFLDDFAAAYPTMPRAEIDRIHARFVTELGRGGRVELEERDAWVTRLVARGHLFDARRRDGTGVMRLVQADSHEVDFPLLLGWLPGDRLLLVR